MIEFIISELTNNKEILSAYGELRDLKYGLISTGNYRKYEIGKIGYLVFRKNEKPLFFIKHYKTSQMNKILENEYKQQLFLHNSYKGLKIPKPLALINVNGINVLVEEAHSGTSIFKILTEGILRENAIKAINYASEVQTALNSNLLLSDFASLEKEVRSLVHDFFTAYDPSDTEKKCIEQFASSYIDRFRNQAVYKRFSNGDFVSKNIILSPDDNSLSLIDFEFVEETHLFQLDWYRFFTYYFPVEPSIFSSLLDYDFQDPVIHKAILSYKSLDNVASDQSTTVMWLLFNMKDFIIRNRVFPSYRKVEERQILGSKLVNVLSFTPKVLGTNGSEKNKIIQDLSKGLEYKDTQIKELEVSVTRETKKNDELTNTLLVEENRINTLEAELAKKESELNLLQLQTQQSITLRLQAKYQQFIERLFRPGTRRRYYYEQGLTGIRVIIDEGWWTFFRRLKNWVSQKRSANKNPTRYLRSVKTSISKSKAIALKVKFPVSSEKPEVSIVIPVYNKLEYTVNCLDSIYKNTTGDYEVIVVDDCSNDDTSGILPKINNLRFIRNERNSGFIDSCNHGAEISCGKYILFLNNDTLVTKNWLPPLLEVMTRENVGAAGSKLIYPDGKLQEAGGIIWNDGSGWNYGRGDDPEKPEYNYVKEVDYCSGACLIVNRELFEKAGGFDERFKPGYYEDTDLCFAFRNLGYKIIYQPLSQVIHFEGVTCGTDVSSGVKSYQEINKRKFVEKWSTNLQKYHYNPDTENLFLARDRRTGKHVLVIDHYVPTYDKDSGSLRMFNILKILSELGHKVTFIGDNLLRTEPYTQELQQVGIEIVYAPYELSVNEYIKKYGKLFNVVLLSRPHIAIKYIDMIKQVCTDAKVIYDTVDLVFLRESRRADLENNPAIMEQASISKKMELYLAKKSDITLVVSPVERDILLKENTSLIVEVVSNIHQVRQPQKLFAGRKDVLFVGGFDHPPNIDAVKFFVLDIFPLVKQKIPDIQFFIVGSNPPKEVLSLHSKDIIVTGYIKDLTPYFDNCKVFVAPLRYGAGVKGKINQSMSYGLPVITTTIGAEGIGLIDGVDALIADKPGDFAEKVIKVYENEELWNKLSRTSIENVEKNYSPEMIKDKLRKFFEKDINKNVTSNEYNLKKAEKYQNVEIDSKLGKTKYYLKRQEFSDRLNIIKKGLEKSVNFYPYAILSNLDHLDNLLYDVGLQTEEILAARTVNDIGGADGDLAFYCEFLGSEIINLIDHAPTNFNQLKGATRLKEALGSNINIFDIDLHKPNGWQNVKESQITIFLGILYHLQNPFLALSELSKKSKYLILSTKIFDIINDWDVSSARCAYFYGPGECNQDPTNWWCFTDECLRNLIDRSGWEIIAYKRFGCTSKADPVDNQRDGRAFAYLKSKSI